ncbi:uncharacterized protein L203_105969 [Cryptococcus depauperatus CBS 7841]|uniref:Uncharacterized protein n=1 Tax=Cryptococcus depauperatus CBS 7841 TaxID=1295531 RepID=A0AAJ8JYB4_9TREE
MTVTNKSSPKEHGEGRRVCQQSSRLELWLLNNGGGGSTSLYLFAFLIAVIILALVSAGLMMRAYWLQRWFQRRVEEALQTSNLIPINVAAALGLRLPDNGRREKEEKHDDLWDVITSLSLTHLTFTPLAPPQVPSLIPIMPNRSI